jgi:hypothetical protein
MKSVYIFSIIGSIILTSLFFSFCSSNATKKEKAPGPTNGFAIVELFTSEGCSSCPPADEAIIRLAGEFPEHVYFLGYHVDYWNYIGWKDEFSSPDYTERQNKYAEILGLSSVYTPQVIINGKKEFVGSRENELRTAIQQELNGPASPAIELTAKNTATGTISVSYKTANTGTGLLNIALVQLKATTNVKRGENSGHTLNHMNVVRSLKTIQVNKEIIADTDFKIPSGLLAKDLKVIAFIQDKKDMKITGAAEAVIQQ